jgi:hypothetical protein
VAIVGARPLSLSEDPTGESVVGDVDEALKPRICLRTSDSPP